MLYKPYSITMRDLAAAGRDNIPRELRTDTGLIYNSPAALDFNSPGAQGFGVKRAGLAIPGSIMLLLAPAAAEEIQLPLKLPITTETVLPTSCWMRTISSQAGI